MIHTRAKKGSEKALPQLLQGVICLQNESASV